MKSRVRTKMLMVLKCGGTAEDNLSMVDQKIYEMYPHNSNDERIVDSDFEVPADFTLDESDSCEVSFKFCLFRFQNVVLNATKLRFFTYILWFFCLYRGTLNAVP